MGQPRFRTVPLAQSMGAFIGDALALGPQLWYYEQSVLRRDYGEWIRDHTTPKPGRYHAVLHAVNGGGQN